MCYIFFLQRLNEQFSLSKYYIRPIKKFTHEELQSYGEKDIQLLNCSNEEWKVTIENDKVLYMYS